jgi:cytosine permease
MLGIFIPPLGGTIIGDFLFTWKGKMPRMEELEFKPLRYSNIIAYLSGTAAAWLGQNLNFGIPPLQGIIVAALMVPVTNALFKAVGSNDAHQLKNNITVQS